MRHIGRKGGPSEPADAGFAMPGASILPSLAFDRKKIAADLPAGITFATSDFEELEVQLDPMARTLWCWMSPEGPPSFTPSMVRELNRLHQKFRLLAKENNGELPFDYYVQGSRIPSIYNMGGDLFFMIDAIRRRDRAALAAYAYGCVEAVHGIWHGFDLPVESICLVEGDALGGGLEGVVCFNTIIAERDAKMGLPEILFGSFPGMGAFSFLSRRLSLSQTERMIRSGSVFTAQDMYEMGIVDILVDRGEGPARVRSYIAEARRHHRLNLALHKSKRIVAPIALSELQEVTDLWVDTALWLAESDLRRMEILGKAQGRRLAKREPA